MILLSLLLLSLLFIHFVNRNWRSLNFKTPFERDHDFNNKSRKLTAILRGIDDLYFQMRGLGGTIIRVVSCRSLLLLFSLSLSPVANTLYIHEPYSSRNINCDAECKYDHNIWYIHELFFFIALRFSISITKDGKSRADNRPFPRIFLKNSLLFQQQRDCK